MLKTEYRVASLSRGYKRSTEGFVEAVADTTPAQIGDEPYMLHKRNPDVLVTVCENRNNGIEKMLSMPEPPQIVVLDDVFQHRYVNPTVNILLTEYGNPFFDDFVLPFGNLREPRRGYRRANIIIITKTPENINPLERYAFTQKLKAKPYQHVFFTSIEYKNPIPLNDGLADMQLDELKNVLFVSGIANPKPAVEKLSSLANVEHLAFADHHNFLKTDFELIANKFQQISGEDKIILTTEKDAVRISNNPHFQSIAQLPIYYLPIEVKFLDKDGQKFSECLTKAVKENVFYLKFNS